MKKFKVQTSRFKVNKGFSLIEMLVVLFVFSILAIIMTQTLALSLRGSRKSESSSSTRENVQYSVNVMDRVLRNAQLLKCSTSTGSKLNYTDEFGNAAYFECVTSGTDTYIASNSATQRITSNLVKITNCSTVFTCTDGGANPDAADVTITATDAKSGASTEGSSITVSTKILLRNY